MASEVYSLNPIHTKYFPFLGNVLGLVEKTKMKNIEANLRHLKSK